MSAAAEAKVVGVMMGHPETIPAVLEIVRDSDFAADRCRRVFLAVVELWERQEPIDEVTVVSRLRERGDLEAAGGAADVANLAFEATGWSGNVEGHARIVAKDGAKRRLRLTAAAIDGLAQSSDSEPAELQAEAEKLLAEAGPRVAGKGLVRVRDLLPDLLVHLEEMTSKEARLGLATGLEAVDARLGPMEKGSLILAAGRPSMGKSAFGICNIAADVVLRQQRAAAIFSVETDKMGVLKRIAGSEARANMAAARRNRDFRDDEYPRLHEIVSRLRGAPLWLDHAGGLTLDQIRVKLRRAVHEFGPMEVVVVDYLQMMTHPKAKSRYEEVSAIGTGLKRLATEFETVVVALAQLSRAVEQRPDKRPMMSDLRESGTLEQDADVVMLLYRPEYYHGPTMKVGKGQGEKVISVEGKAEIILAKVRDGETGAALVGFEKEYTHFYDLPR
jgi:replicative DNA helicase